MGGGWDAVAAPGGGSGDGGGGGGDAYLRSRPSRLPLGSLDAPSLASLRLCGLRGGEERESILAYKANASQSHTHIPIYGLQATPTQELLSFAYMNSKTHAG